MLATKFTSFYITKRTQKQRPCILTHYYFTILCISILPTKIKRHTFSRVFSCLTAIWGKNLPPHKKNFKKSVDILNSVCYDVIVKRTSTKRKAPRNGTPAGHTSKNPSEGNLEDIIIISSAHQKIKEDIMMNKKIAAMVTDKLVAIMEQGVIPWDKPWTAAGGAISHTTGKRYSFVNQFMLGCEGEWITYNQAKKEGGHIKKGAHGVPVVFWKQIPKADEETGEILGYIPCLRYYTVFEIADCEGIERKYNPENVTPADPISAGERLIDHYLKKSGVTMQRDTENERAFYSPINDKIVVPCLDQYAHANEFYSTAFHEMTHSTGHKSRLDRLAKDAAFGNEEYSKEELVAEIGAAALCHTCGIDTARTDRNSAAYLQSWLRALKNDPAMILAAAGKAEKAVDFITEGFDTENC